MAWTLHSAWRATAPYRVRIGLKLKGCTYDYAAVDLIHLEGSMHRTDIALGAERMEHVHA